EARGSGELAVGLVVPTESIEAEAAIVPQARPLVVVAEASGRQHIVDRRQRLLEPAEVEQHGGALATRPEPARGTCQNGVEQRERTRRLLALAREHGLPLHQVDRIGKSRATAQHLATERGRVPLLVELLEAIEEPFQDFLVARAHGTAPRTRRR